MTQWKKTIVAMHTSLRDVIEAIDSSSMQIALVVDDRNRLRGTVTDGDVRRGILKGVALNDPVTNIMNPTPTFCRTYDSKETILAVMKNKQIRHIPVLDEQDVLVDLETMDELVRPDEKDNWVILMAGGLGTRLYPLTEDCPKPLLKVGGKPLLETILENITGYGFKKFYISVNYRADMIEQYFGDGSNWGVEIRYLREDKRLGTAGALGLLPERPNESLIVMNGDLLTKVNFKHLLNFHLEHEAAATMCVRDYEYQVPYGVVRVDKQRFYGIDEKPIQRFFVNAGIYVLEPSALHLIPKDEFFDMPSLFDKMVERKSETVVFPIREYWMDIGRMDDFERANVEFLEVFG